MAKGSATARARRRSQGIRKERQDRQSHGKWGRSKDKELVMDAEGNGQSAGDLRVPYLNFL